MHRRFSTEGSDFVSFVRLFDHLRERQRELTNNQFRKLCRTEFLNYLRIREWQDLFSQLRQVASSLDIRMSSEPAHLDQVHQALLSGLLSQIGMKDTTGKEFRGARQAKFAIGRGSVVANKSPKWVMAGELVETNRLWARVCAPIQPEWAERLGEHLVKRSYGEPEWSAERGTTMVIERVSLYGLPIVAGRNVQYGRIDQQDARSMFIHFALVEGDWDTHHDFMEKNRSLVAEVRSLEDRLRRQVILIDDNALYDFYDERLPNDITSSRDFDRWWKKEKGRKPDLLTLTREHLVKGQDDHVPLDDFPTEWQQDDLIFGLSYVFDPGAANDGVTVHIPLAVLNQVEPVGFEWLVPGVRLELMTSLLKALPKTLRRELVPLSDFAQAATVEVAEDGPLLPALAAHLSAKDWRDDHREGLPDVGHGRSLPNHLCRARDRRRHRRLRQGPQQTQGPPAQTHPGRHRRGNAGRRAHGPQRLARGQAGESCRCNDIGWRRAWLSVSCSRGRWRSRPCADHARGAGAGHDQWNPAPP